LAMNQSDQQVSIRLDKILKFAPLWLPFLLNQSFASLLILLTKPLLVLFWQAADKIIA
jgi:hypothetical protein